MENSNEPQGCLDEMVGMLMGMAVLGAVAAALGKAAMMGWDALLAWIR